MVIIVLILQKKLKLHHYVPPSLIGRPGLAPRQDPLEDSFNSSNWPQSHNHHGLKSTSAVPSQTGFKFQQLHRREKDHLVRKNQEQQQGSPSLGNNVYSPAGPGYRPTPTSAGPGGTSQQWVGWEEGSQRELEKAWQLGPRFSLCRPSSYLTEELHVLARISTLSGGGEEEVEGWGSKRSLNIPPLSALSSLTSMGSMAKSKTQTFTSMPSPGRNLLVCV